MNLKSNTILWDILYNTNWIYKPNSPKKTTWLSRYGAASSLPGARLALGPSGGLGCFGAPLMVADSVSEHVDVVLLPLELFRQLELLGVQLMEPVPELLSLLRQLLLVQVVDVERFAALHQGLLLLFSGRQLLALLLVDLLQVATERFVCEYLLLLGLLF